MCYLHETTTKMKACHEHRKTHDLIKKKGSLDRKSFAGMIEQRWLFFWQNKNMLHSAMVVQFPFGLC
jgi:hypothetical protein